MDKEILQANKVMSLIASETRDLKGFLYELSYLNSMAAKGYKEENIYNPMIYSIKEVALRYIYDNFRRYCLNSYGDLYTFHGQRILYVFFNKRQYSFHHGIIEWDYIVYTRWDGMKEGWKMSDEEYFSELEKNRDNKYSIQDKRTDQPDFLYKLEKLKKKREEERRCFMEEKLKKEFFIRLETIPQARKAKCFKERDFRRCFNLYSEKIGITGNEYQYLATWK